MTGINFGVPLVEKTSQVGIELEGPYGTHDALRNGFYSAAYSLAPKHPIQQSHSSIEQAEEARQMYIATSTLGTHMPLRFKFEKDISRANSWLGGIKSKRLTDQIISGTDEDIDVSDIFLINPSIRSVSIKDDFINI